VGSGSVLDFGGDRRRGRSILGVNLWRPIVTNGDLLRRCVEVRIAIELSFGVVSGVGPGIHVPDEVYISQGEWAVSGVVSGIFWHFRPILYNGDIMIDDRLVCEKLTI